MADHYYTQTPTSQHDEWQINADVFGHTLKFTTDAGVFSRDGLDKGTEILLNALPLLNGRILDLGCGWGAVGVALGKEYPDLELMMTDINQRAVDLSLRNLAANGVENAQVVQGDSYESISGTFDAIITNPPIRAGKVAIYAMFADARQYLTPNGVLYIVIRKQQGAPSALKYLREIYAEAEVIDREAGFWVICARMTESAQS